jgi:hypothetical protein
MSTRARVCVCVCERERECVRVCVCVLQQNLHLSRFCSCRSVQLGTRTRQRWDLIATPSISAWAHRAAQFAHHRRCLRPRAANTITTIEITYDNEGLHIWKLVSADSKAEFHHHHLHHRRLHHLHHPPPDANIFENFRPRKFRTTDLDRLVK